MPKFFCAILLAVALICSSVAAAGDATAGEKRYHESCHACYGTAGKGLSSYPKFSGNPVEYTREKLIVSGPGKSSARIQRL